jgi:hypothetical protein
MLLHINIKFPFKLSHKSHITANITKVFNSLNRTFLLQVLYVFTEYHIHIIHTHIIQGLAEIPDDL